MEKERVEKIRIPVKRINYTPEWRDFDFSRIGDGFLKIIITVDSTKRSIKADRLFMYDHRKQVVQVAKHYEGEGYDGFLLHDLTQAVRQPGLIQVVQVGNREYVNIYDCSGETPDAVMTIQWFIWKAGSRYEILRDYSHWSWNTTAQSRTGRHEECAFVSVTDSKRRVLLYLSGVNTHSDKNYMVLSNEMKWVTDEEAARLKEEMKFIPYYQPVHQLKPERLEELGIKL
jgi:hypothetical protein